MILNCHYYNRYDKECQLIIPNLGITFHNFCYVVCIISGKPVDSLNLSAIIKAFLCILSLLFCG
jgi:hypothetical protein